MVASGNSGSMLRRPTSLSRVGAAMAPVWSLRWTRIVIVTTGNASTAMPADHAIPPALQLAMAENAHAHITEVEAPRLVHDLRPRRRTSVILQAVHTTT